MDYFHYFEEVARKAHRSCHLRCSAVARAHEQPRSVLDLVPLHPPYRGTSELISKIVHRGVLGDNANPGGRASLDLTNTQRKAVVPMRTQNIPAHEQSLVSKATYLPQ